ncbi:MAG TPA: tandem-95 repeat protein [Solirubrobacteraceae bacterium]|jgi:hypothetical protein
MAEAGCSALDTFRGWRTTAATLLVLLFALLALAPSADAAVSRQVAAEKALAKLGVRDSTDAVIVFGLRTTLRPRTIISQSGPSGGAVASRALRSAFAKQRNRRIRKAGAQVRRADVLLRTGSERTWFFFEDQGPHQAFEHPGRVVLVGADTGRVRVSEETRWVPLVDGKAPAFFQNAANYESDRYQVFERPWSSADSRNRARARQASDSPDARQQVADALAAEKSCAFRISDTLGDFFDFGRVDQTRSRLGNFFESLEKLNSGFVSRRYTTKSAKGPIDEAQALIDEAGCKDLFLYAAGAAPKTGEAGIVIGMRPAPGGLLEWHVLTAAELEQLVKANPGVTFKFLFDAPYSPRINTRLIDESNTVLLISSGGPGDTSFTFLPEVLGPNGVQGNSGNPDQLLEFTNAVLNGLEAFVRSPGEIAQWVTNRGLGGPSMMSWMMARAMSLSPAFLFAAPIEMLKLPVAPTPPPPPPPADTPVPAAAPNRAPQGTTPAQPTNEDTPKAITLTATDPDGDSLTFTITDQPDHGDLTGTPPNLVYTPDQDFDGTDSFTYQVSDGRGGTDTQTVQIPVIPDNDAAAVTTTSGGSAAYTENAPGVEIDPALTISDPDSTQLESATVSIVDGTFQAGDQLEFVNQSGITGSYNAGTGVLTLTGTASVSDYEQALQSVKFSSTQDNPTASRTIEFVAEDGDEAGVPAERTVTITPVNDAPVASASPGDLSYTENGGAVAVDSLLTLGDPDDTNLESAEVAIASGFESSSDSLSFVNTANITGSYDSGTGVLTLTGTDTVANYQAALRSITFASGSDNPVTSKSVEFTVNDGSLDSNTTTKAVDVTRENDAPTVSTSGGSTSVAEDAQAVVDGGLTVGDVDDTNLEGATVRVSQNFQSGDNLIFVDQSGITGAYNTGTGVLTLTGTATLSDYQAALRSIKFQTTNDAPAGAKQVEFKVDDGDDDSNAATKLVTVSGVNDAPTVTTSAGSLTYDEGDGPVAVDSGLSASDPDSANLAGATVQITGNHVQAEDELAFTDTASITGSYNDSTGMLTLSGSDTLANYQAALRSVTYENSSDNPSTSTRTVSFQVDDGSASSNLSNVATRDISGFAPTNDAPVVTTSAGATSFTEGGSAVVVDGALTVTDVDDTSLESGQVRISQNFQSGDSLNFVDQNGISGTYNTGTGVLTLTGTASVSDYQTALRSITFDHAGDNPSSGKQVEFTVNDGDTGSNAPVKGINLTGVNDVPTVNTSAGDTAYTEGGAAATVDNALTISDPDDTNLESAQVQISSGFESGDALVFVDQNGITGVYNSGTGVLTLTGTASVANYQTALRSIQFQTTHDDPATSKTVEFKVNDGDGDSNAPTKGLAITRSNDAPTVVTSAGDTSYTEGNSGTVIDSALTVSDPDDTNLEGGQVRISSGFESGDDLTFVNTANISGVYNTGTGVLTLTGTDTVANYQAALRSITFDNTVDDDLTSPKTIEFKVNDGDADSSAATKNIAITPVNDAPTITNTSSALSYTEGDGAVAVDSALAVSDPDSTSLAGATVQITSNFSSADDELAFTDTANITGAYNDSTGTLTLSGTDTVANYQAALRSVTFENVNDNPSGSKTVSFQVDDGAASNNLSNVGTRDINLTGANDAPTVTTSGGSTSYTEGDPATTVDSALTVADPDDTNIESGQVRISSGFESGDDLVFVDQNGISGVYNTGTGVLTLSGTASVADYQTALRSIQYRHTGDNPTTSKTVEFKVNDGDADSNAATKSLSITRVNDAPTLTTTASALSYTEGDGAVAVDNGLTLTDPDSTQIQGATVQITSNFVSADDELAFTNFVNITGVYNDSTGTLTLSGNDTVANYQAALRSVTYENVDDDPSGTKTVSFQATDAEGAASNVATRDISLNGANDAPVVTTSAGDTSYTEGDPATTVDGSLTVTDADDTNLEGGQVRISANFQTGDDLVFVNQNGISGVYNTGTGVLTLSGTSSVANYQTALRSIQFQTTNDNPSASKTVEFKVNDGDVDSNAATKNLAITAVNDGPTIITSGGNASFVEDAGAVAVDNALTVADPDSANISGATVSISGNFDSSEDQLVFVDTASITGVYNSGTGVLTLSGTDTVANYQAALRSVQYDNTDASSPGTATRTVSFQVTDTGSAASNVASRGVTVAQANDAPVVTPTNGSTAYTEGDPATTIDGGITVTDAEDTNLEGGQVRISSGFQSGDDLVFVNQNGISGVYNTGTGVLTLSGTSTVANYQTALRSIQFQTSNDAPVTSKTVEFKVNDGDVDSNAPTKEIAVTPVNDAPSVVTTAGNTSFIEDTTGPTEVDPGVTLNDFDSANLSGATVSITNNFDSSEDVLLFTNQLGITGAYNSSTGVLTLSGTSSVANYQTALRSVEYDNSDLIAPITNPRTFAFQVTDTSAADSNVATKTVTVASVNDPPVVTTSAGNASYTEDDPATTIDGGITVADADDTNLEGGQVRISSGFQTGDDLVFVNQNGISGVYNSGTGVLTLTGTSSVANYQTALRSIQFQSTNQEPVTSKTVEFKVNDGDIDSNAATKQIDVTPTNDGPVVTTTGTTLAYTENDPATAVDSGLTIDDAENDNLSGGSASITANYQAGQDDLNWTDNNLSDNITLDGVNSTDQTIVLTGLDTDANYQAALRAVTYTNTSDNPSNATRTVTFSATDQPGLTGSDTRTLSVTPVDDPPDAQNDTATVLEDAAATSIPVLTNDTDPDGGPKSIASAGDPANGTVVLTGGSPGAHTGLTYQPDPNYCNDPPGTTPDTFNYTVNGGDTATVSMTVTCVNDAPVADDETFNSNDSAIGNTTLQVDDPDDNKAAPTNPHTEITGDILAGDTDIDGPGPLTVTTGTFATNDGGSVTLEADGDFVFQPAPATSCTDTSDFFDYTVEDSGSPEQTDTGRVTIAIAGCVWYVSNNAPTGPGNNDGSSDTPFVTLAQAETASGSNHTVFVFDGDNTSTGYQTGYQMNSGERLIGEHEGLVVDPDENRTANTNGALTADTLHPANAGAHPTITGTNEDVIQLDDNNEVRGFNLDPAGTGGGIAGATGDTGGGTIDDVNIVDTGTAASQPLFELDATTGTFNVSNLVVNNQAASSPPNTATGVRVNNAGTAVFSPGSQISIAITGAKGLEAVSTALGTSTFDDVTVAGSSAGGVRLDTTTGTIALGDGTGTDLSLTTTSGSEAALRINSGGTVTVDSAGTDDLHATGGPALDVTGTSGPTLSLDDVDSTNSANDGINLDGLGTGTFTAASGDIAGASGISFDLNGGSGTITYPGNFGNGSGTTAFDVTGRSGGVVTLSGPISDTNDAGGGANLASNTGGSTVFSGTTKQFNTGASDAVTFTSSDGHTLAFTGGNLDIDTTSGNGLNATTSGTLQVSGGSPSGNTIDSTALGASNRGLNISDTDIAAADVTFQRISTSGGTNGIRVNNNTNTSGGLFVSGNGGICTAADQTGCSGGVIQTATGAGIDLISHAGETSLTRMNVKNGTDDGIRANSAGSSAGNGIALANSVITSNGNANTESGLDWTNVNGTSSIVNDAINSNFDFNAQLVGTTGTLNLTVQSSTFNSAGVDDGLQIISNGTSTINSTIGGAGVGNTFSTNKGDGIDYGSTAASPGATSNTSIKANTVTGSGATATDGGIAWTPDGNAKVNIDGNTITGVSATALSVQSSSAGGSSSTTDATVTNNIIGTAGQVNSGSDDGDGIQVVSPGDGTSKFLVKDNDIHGYDKNGMKLRGSESTNGADTDMTVQGNDITDPDTTHAETGILLQAGSLSTDVVDVCANVGGAGALANTFSGALNFAGPGIGNFWLSLRFPNSKMRAPGYSGTTFTDRQNYFLGRNTGFSGGAAPYVEDGSQNLTTPSPASCLTPTLPSTG